jgi:hypothetical protein
MIQQSIFKCQKQSSLKKIMAAKKQNFCIMDLWYSTNHSILMLFELAYFVLKVTYNQNLNQINFKKNYLEHAHFLGENQNLTY